MREIRGTYGCNMAFRTTSIGSVPFDVRLANETMNMAGNERGADAEAITLIKKWYLERTKFANTLR
jgi:hypothetical protein